ncbi:Mrp/NBP35 family ATP-binding protein [soil metagenome]
MTEGERDALLRKVAAALTGVVHPETEEDIVSSGRVRDLSAADDGTVRFRFALRSDDPAVLVREAREVARRVEGVTAVKVDVALPAAATAETPLAGSSERPPAADRPSPLRPGSVPAPTPSPDLLPAVERVIAVSSGKGGVGKTTVAVNLAVALAAGGARVGILDADVYGPNVPLMLGENRRPLVTGEKGEERIAPREAHGVRLMSLGLLLEPGQPAIMRGPLISGVLKQFLEQVEWGELDYLVVDMPPGTGDAQLSLVQTIELDGVVLVTTPQDASTGDVRRAIAMFERVNAPVLGVVENMAGFRCPCCGEITELFGSGGGERLAADAGVPFLGSVPLELAVREGGDSGQPIVAAQPESASGAALLGIADAIVRST